MWRAKSTARPWTIASLWDNRSSHRDSPEFFHRASFHELIKGFDDGFPHLHQDTHSAPSQVQEPCCPFQVFRRWHSFNLIRESSLTSKILFTQQHNNHSANEMLYFNSKNNVAFCLIRVPWCWFDGSNWSSSVFYFNIYACQFHLVNINTPLTY